MDLQQQIDYYRARSAEYNEWFYRKGRYDKGEEWNRVWFSEVETLTREVTALPACGTILDLACGTGIWTRHLSKIGRGVTAVDASPEVIEINRRSVQSPSVGYVRADLFTWEPDEEYDLVFSSFWLSHVPPERLDRFLEMMRRATRTGGRIFAMDSLSDARSSAADHAPKQPNDFCESRKLNDGREFKVVKVYYKPDKLQSILARHGFEAEVKTTGYFFWYACGSAR